MPKTPTTNNTDELGSSRPYLGGGAPFTSSAAARTLRRNQACLTCRKRKLRCDAARPTCGTCLRSYNHTLLHLKPGQEKPIYPICSFEDYFRNSSSDDGASTSIGRPPAVALPQAPAMTSQPPQSPPPPTLIPLATPSERQLQERIQELEEKLNVAAAHAAPPRNDLSNHQSPYPVASASLDAVSSSSRVDSQFPGPIGHESPAAYVPNLHGAHPILTPPWFIPASPSLFDTFPPTLRATQAPQRPLTHGHPHQTPFPIHLPPLGSTSGEGPRLPSLTPDSDFLSNSDGNAQMPSPLPALLVDPLTGRATSRDGVSGLKDDAFFEVGTIDLPRTRQVPETIPLDTWDSVQPNGDRPLPLNEPFTGGKVGGAQDVDFSNLMGSIVENDASEPLSESPDAFFLSLLWPGWPSHLPAPGFLERIVETFFDAVPLGPILFNRGRFMSRLGLPPTHSLFPHPAVLHSICALTARFLGGVVVLDPADFQVLRARANREHSKNELDALGPKPQWDGLTSTPTDHLALRPGIDRDFVEIHASWAELYLAERQEFAQEWLSLCQAHHILAVTCHVNALWVAGWRHIGAACRMAISLGLLSRDGQISTGAGFKDALLPATNDPIDRMERANLFYQIFSQETQASASSGWPTSLHHREVALGIPTSYSSFPSDWTPPPATQFMYSDNLLTYHPPENRNSLSLFYKSVVLARKINELVRYFLVREIIDPREEPEFKKLDEISQIFSANFPSHLRRPVRLKSRQAVDSELFAAHAQTLIAIIFLHDRYANVSDLQDVSRSRIILAARSLVDGLHQLNATAFDYSRLPAFMSFAWFTGARVLIQFLRVAREEGDSLAQLEIRNDIEVLRVAVSAVGKRFPIGTRTDQMICQLLSVVEGISPGDLLYPDEPNVFPGPKSDIANFSSLGGLKDARCGGARLFPIDELLPGSSPHSRAKTP